MEAEEIKRTGGVTLGSGTWRWQRRKWWDRRYRCHRGHRRNWHCRLSDRYAAPTALAFSVMLLLVLVHVLAMDQDPALGGFTANALHLDSNIRRFVANFLGFCANAFDIRPAPLFLRHVEIDGARRGLDERRDVQQTRKTCSSTR